MKMDFAQLQLQTLLDEIIIKKKNGEMDAPEKLINQNEEWRGVLKYNVLNDCMAHISEKIRLSALSLLIEARKSTLEFNDKELHAIMIFLRHNIIEQMEYIPLIKKAFNRINKSLIVLRRQKSTEEKARCYAMKTGYNMDTDSLIKSNAISSEIDNKIQKYMDFLNNLKDFCIMSNLYPDSTYRRRNSSLQILCLMLEILKDDYKNFKWTVQHAEQLFECMLLDTYECNKKLLFKILKSLDLTLLNLDSVEQVSEMMNIALKLGNSKRPIDSITATYILKTVALSPVCQSVLNDYFKNYNISFEISTNIHLQLIYLVVQKLKIIAEMAKKKIVMAIKEYSIYGYIYCLRCFLNEYDYGNEQNKNLWNEIMKDIITICFDLDNSVAIIMKHCSLEDDSPIVWDLQKIMKNDLSDLEKNLVTPQMILLCSWRTVKEVSLLFGELTYKLQCSQKSSQLTTLLSDAQIIEIGKHFVTLLCITKHRGAFEQAYVGFTQFCTALWRSDKSSLNILPKLWLHNILLAITGLSNDNTKLCTTRRSAGIPFLIQALIISEPRKKNNLQNSSLYSVMRILLGFCDLSEYNDNFNFWKKIKKLMYTDTVFSNFINFYVELNDVSSKDNIEKCEIQVTEIKTHTLNILRALFKHSQLGEAIQPFICDGLIAAFKSYDGKTWMERNAATLLFSALIIRIFGVQRTKDHINLTTDNKMTGKLFFEKYPSLLSFMLDELQTFVSIDDSLIKPSVQSILLLLSRLYISHIHDDTNIIWKINEFVTLVSQCAKSPVFKTREMAARALVPLLTESNANSFVTNLLNQIVCGQQKSIPLNTVHGYLLQVLEIVKKIDSVKKECIKSEFVLFINNSQWILKNLEKNNDGIACYPIASTYIAIVYELVKWDNKIDIVNLNLQLSWCKHHLTNEESLKIGVGRELYRVILTKFVSYIGKQLNKSENTTLNNVLSNIYLHILKDRESKVQMIAWSTICDVFNEDSYIYSHATEEICDSLSNISMYDPDLQDSIFNFLNVYLENNNKFHNHDKLKSVHRICYIILENINTTYNFSKRKTFLRLVGTSYITLLHFFKNSEKLQSFEEEFYNIFCDSCWISTLDENLRPTVFNSLYEIFYWNKPEHGKDCMVNWWTTVLKLLLDENSTVRKETSKIIATIEPSNSVKCITETIDIFFDKFYKNFALKNPYMAVVALFYWGTSLSDDFEYDMDDTDVFNKCNNYDCYEAVEISKKCSHLTYKILNTGVCNSFIPLNAQQWISAHLNVPIPQNITFKELIELYSNSLSPIETKLCKLLNLMYKEKLIQVMQIDQFKTIHGISPNILK